MQNDRLVRAQHCPAGDTWCQCISNLTCSVIKQGMGWGLLSIDFDGLGKQLSGLARQSTSPRHRHMSEVSICPAGQRKEIPGCYKGTNPHSNATLC